VRQQLFGDRKGVLGSEVRLNGLPYRIVGLMPVKTQNGSYNGLDGEKIYVPYETLARDMPPIDPNFVPGRVANLIYSPASVTQWKEARKQVMVVLGRNHGFEPDDTGAISTFDTVENAEMIDGIFDSMTVFLGIIAMVTLTLGGVGVMNIMLVSVTERTQEIGLRKALGATRRRILMDFIVEGIVLVLISGFFGWGFAYGLSWLVSFAPKIDYFSGLPVDNTTTAIAFGALAVVALLSTIIPASRAASLTPVEALRHER
jgi:putative ABC transport system permease protein